MVEGLESEQLAGLPALDAEHVGTRAAPDFVQNPVLSVEFGAKGEDIVKLTF